MFWFGSSVDPTKEILARVREFKTSTRGAALCVRNRIGRTAWPLVQIRFGRKRKRDRRELYTYTRFEFITTRSVGRNARYSPLVCYRYGAYSNWRCWPDELLKVRYLIRSYCSEHFVIHINGVVTVTRARSTQQHTVASSRAAGAHSTKTGTNKSRPRPITRRRVSPDGGARAPTSVSLNSRLFIFAAKNAFYDVTYTLFVRISFSSIVHLWSASSTIDYYVLVVKE